MGIYTPFVRTPKEAGIASTFNDVFDALDAAADAFLVGASLALPADQAITTATTTRLSWGSVPLYAAGGAFVGGTAQLTGTVSTTSGSATLTGSGTLFESELQVGQMIRVGTHHRTVTAIASNTSLTVHTNWSHTASGQAFYESGAGIVAMETGKYLCVAQVMFAAHATGERKLTLESNRSWWSPSRSYFGDGSNPTVLALGTVREMDQYDHYMINVYQTSGGSLNVQRDGTFFSMWRIG